MEIHLARGSPTSQRQFLRVKKDSQLAFGGPSNGHRRHGSWLTVVAGIVLRPRRGDTGMARSLPAY